MPAIQRAHTANAAFVQPRDGSKLWRSRGYIPHFDEPGAVQFYTFRQADSLPQMKLLEARENFSALTDPQKRTVIEKYLDAGYGSCLLGRPHIANLVEDTLLFFDGQRYILLEWVVMPNHVHVMVQMDPAWPMAKILHSWKSYTANMTNKMLGRTGPLYQPEYFDRWIRDEEHLRNARRYIHLNPVKAGLCPVPEAWPYSSASLRLNELQAGSLRSQDRDLPGSREPR